MKKIFLIMFLAILGISQGMAQDYEYKPFVREGVKWIYTTKDNFSHYYYHTLEFKGDKEINGKCYKIMHKYSGEEINWEDDTIPVYLREEDRVVYGIVPDGKIYHDCPVGFFNDKATNDKIAAGEEFVLYDFNDPVEFIESWITVPDYYHCTVIPDMTMVAGRNAKRYISACDGKDFCLIEGIGYDGVISAYPLYVSGTIQNAACLSHVIENGEVIYTSESSHRLIGGKEPKLPIGREGVQWVNERVVSDHGVVTKSYYTYEFRGTNYRDYPICYQYIGDTFDENSAMVAAVLECPKDMLEYCYTHTFFNNVPFESVLNEGRNLIYSNTSLTGYYSLYQYTVTHSEIEFDGTVNYYITHQKEDFLTRENFIEIDPLVIEGMECRRFAYLGEDSEPLAYITEGIGFDSRDMGDLLTPFTRKPDPTADHQEYWGLSHVIKDGEIIYKGMRYDESLFGGIAGDVNGDGQLTIADVTALIDLLLQGNPSFKQSADLDGSGSLTIRDVTALIDLLLSDNN